MQELKYYYIVELQFLGFRFHGWQKQPNLKTIQGELEKVINKILPDGNAKIRGGSRTDSMVSAEKYYFSLTLTNLSISDIKSFIETLNYMLPADMRVLNVTASSQKRNMINSSKCKEYRYYFSFGMEKPHPFSAPIITFIKGEMDLKLMERGSKLFEGVHSFRQYCYRPHENKDFIKTINRCEIKKNEHYTANFFPENTYYIKVIGHSFMRHQVRLMAGTLFRLGLNEITLEEVVQSLKGESDQFLGFMAPASGLILHDIEFAE